MKNLIPILIWLCLGLILLEARAYADDIGGIYPGMAASEAIQNLGEPHPQPKFAENKVLYVYQNRLGPDSRLILEATPDSNIIMRIVAINLADNWRTRRGIVSGSSARQVAKAYGKPFKKEEGTFSDMQCFSYYYRIKSISGYQGMYFIFQKNNSSLIMTILEAER